MPGRRAGRRAAAGLRNAATEIRRLAHDLQPAPVEDRGLESALANYIATLDAREIPRIRLHADVPGSLPTAVTQGAYLVALEALNNVVRRPRLKCVVTVNVESGELVLRVVDNGVGLAQPYVEGQAIFDPGIAARVLAATGSFEAEPPISCSH